MSITVIQPTNQHTCTRDSVPFLKKHRTMTIQFEIKHMHTVHICNLIIQVMTSSITIMFQYIISVILLCSYVLLQTSHAVTLCNPTTCIVYTKAN